MTKRAYRYFFDFLDGQTEWLNQMAAQGWRLAKCGQLSYEFESCAPGEYEYSVEFVADRPFSDSKAYKGFLESIGYKTFYKNLNVGVAAGKAKWRPWARGAGQIATAPGGYFKELLIVEKKRDGKPFELHSDLTDKLSLYKRIRGACLWSTGGMFALAAMCLSFAAWSLLNGAVAVAAAALCALAAAPCALCGLFWLKPLRRISAKIRAWEDEAKTNEYEPANGGTRTKRALVFAAVAALLILFGIAIFRIAAGGGVAYRSGSALMFVGNSGSSHWNGSYRELNGFRQRSVSLKGGTRVFAVEIVTDSGEIDLSIKGNDGTVYYSGSAIPTSAFSVVVDGADGMDVVNGANGADGTGGADGMDGADGANGAGGADKVVLRIDAKSHSGSYKINWGE
ncbi:MAG: DUF2812 domain-containing protein [Clostridiales bacterium]|jgi:hypothetical protein|nr:DUF2812 domain-containing protein [Clostridiales bacterium]